MSPKLLAAYQSLTLSLLFNSLFFFPTIHSMSALYSQLLFIAGLYALSTTSPNASLMRSLMRSKKSYEKAVFLIYAIIFVVQLLLPATLQLKTVYAMCFQGVAIPSIFLRYSTIWASFIANCFVCVENYDIKR